MERVAASGHKVSVTAGQSLLRVSQIKAFSLSMTPWQPHHNIEILTFFSQLHVLGFGLWDGYSKILIFFLLKCYFRFFWWFCPGLFFFCFCFFPTIFYCSDLCTECVFVCVHVFWHLNNPYCIMRYLNKGVLTLFFIK